MALRLIHTHVAQLRFSFNHSDRSTIQRALNLPPLPPRAALADVGEHLVVAGVGGDVERGPALPRGARGVGAVGHQQLGQGEAAGAAAGGLQRRAAVRAVAVDVDLLGVAGQQPVQLLVPARLHRRLELKEREATRDQGIPRPKC